MTCVELSHRTLRASITTFVPVLLVILALKPCWKFVPIIVINTSFPNVKVGLILVIPCESVEVETDHSPTTGVHPVLQNHSPGPLHSMFRNRRCQDTTCHSGKRHLVPVASPFQFPTTGVPPDAPKPFARSPAFHARNHRYQDTTYHPGKRRSSVPVAYSIPVANNRCPPGCSETIHLVPCITLRNRRSQGTTHHPGKLLSQSYCLHSSSQKQVSSRVLRNHLPCPRYSSSGPVVIKIPHTILVNADLWSRSRLHSSCQQQVSTRVSETIHSVPCIPCSGTVVVKIPHTILVNSYLNLIVSIPVT